MFWSSSLKHSYRAEKEWCHYPHLTDENIEVQVDQVTCSKYSKLGTLKKKKTLKKTLKPELCSKNGDPAHTKLQSRASILIISLKDLLSKGERKPH